MGYRLLILAFRVSVPWAPDRCPLQQSQLQLPSQSRGLPAAPSSGPRCSAWVLNGPPSAPSDIPLDRSPTSGSTSPATQTPPPEAGDIALPAQSTAPLLQSQQHPRVPELLLLWAMGFLGSVHDSCGSTWTATATVLPWLTSAAGNPNRSPQWALAGPPIPKTTSIMSLCLVSPVPLSRVSAIWPALLHSPFACSCAGHVHKAPIHASVSTLLWQKPFTLTNNYPWITTKN